VRIERLEVVPFALPFREPYVTARGRLERRELILVRLHADGLAGVGETTSLALRAGTPFAAIGRELVVRGAPLIEGIPFAPSDWAATVDRLAGSVSRQALAALDLALLDLAGKLSGVPAWKLLGAHEAKPLMCNASLVAGDPPKVTADALIWAERGFRTFKLKVGVEGDVEQVALVRSALGGAAVLRVDANGVWDVDEAVSKLGRMAPLELAEQPVATLEEMAELRLRTSVALAADESVSNADDARRAVPSCDAATVKVAKVGGVRASLETARWLPVYLSSALDGPVGIAAAGHAAQAMPNSGLAHGLATGLLFADSIAGKECVLEGPMLTLPDAPGLGVEIDERALARFRM
jgi:L-alanine-DL-glutamate epimerase-like enolase superfamily enzyme